MITDRTQADVDNAVEIRANKVKTFQTLTEDDITTLERGFLTINTLNRIIKKQVETKKMLNEIGYYPSKIINKTWAIGDMFTEEDIEIIISNENTLRDSFFTYSDTPKEISTSLHYENINAIEKLLVDLDEMIDDMVSRFKRCGTFNCGER